MAVLNQCISQKNRVFGHQQVQKFEFFLAIARQSQLILDCFIPKLKLMYEDSESIKADRVNTVVLSLCQIKRWAFFWKTRYSIWYIFIVKF